ncbi:hypothetical protein O6H91_11G101000 [Diphasiastrum complanatum]|nr:hypothetical protein O6H91_11G101000 [Diphasiastrum complanatum]
MRKTLVFYRGRAPNGQKTDWIMHEYRLEDESSTNCTNEEGWVVCRVFKKRLIHRRIGENDAACCYEEQVALLPELESPENLLKENSYFTHPFVCKEELDLEDYEPYQYSFSQFPQMGSPSSYCDGSHSSVVGLILESSSREINHPLPLLFEVPELDGHRPKPNARSDLGSGSQEDAITEWSVVDRLVAEQLGQDQTSKDLSLRLPTSCSESMGEVASLIQASKASQQLDYSYPGDVDLWSFVR